MRYQSDLHGHRNRRSQSIEQVWTTGRDKVLIGFDAITEFTRAVRQSLLARLVEVVLEVRARAARAAGSPASCT
ncbi:hypothetical protein ACIP6X_43495 [Streptomyces coeruleorubidus]|uniref:hypothetical protein n=1 Tax=Streptomyces coeruleorubidus TaxID=116188 RepID=UPI0037F5E287